MAKVKFVENKFLDPPYVHAEVRFDRYGEEKELVERLAVLLLTDHPYAFQSNDIVVGEEKKEEGNIAIRFVRNKFLDSYTYKTYFFREPGDILYVHESDARYMLETHPDKFELVDDTDDKKKDMALELLDEVPDIEDDGLNNVEEDPDDELQKIMDAIGNESLRISAIADNMGVDWQSIRRPVQKLVKDGKIIVSQEEFNGLKVKMYSLAG